MEATYVYRPKAQNVSPFFPLNRIKKLGNSPSSVRFMQSKRGNNNGVAAIGCVALGSPSPASSSSSSSSSSSVVALAAAAEILDSEEEWLEIENLKHKCKDQRRGMVELLECLEREAIMGDDEGKEPTDYNRRARIFDKSSKVFQALKETNDP